MPKATVKVKPHKGKRHPAHAASLLRIARECRESADRLMPEAAQAMSRLSFIFEREGKRLRGIVR